MSRVIEHIKQELSALRPAERFDLWRDLGAEFDPPMATGETADSVEAAWTNEIAARVKETEEGTVELISGDAADRRIDSLFAELGIRRRPA